jgi:hypothetical protein
MKKDNFAPNEEDTENEMQAEYTFRGGKRGVYAERYSQGTNLVALSPDVAAVFPDSEAVNAALRTLVRAARRSVKAKPHKEHEVA